MRLPELPDWLRVPTEQLAAVAVASGVLLFAPDGWLSVLGLDWLREQTRPWLGTLFLLSGSVVGVKLTVDAFLWARDRLRERRLRVRGKRRLRNLTPDEKELLRAYFEEDTRTRELSVMDGNVQGLDRAGILRCVAKTGVMGGFVFELRGWAREYLREHPELLEPDPEMAGRETGGAP